MGGVCKSPGPLVWLRGPGGGARAGLGPASAPLASDRSPDWAPPPARPITEDYLVTETACSLFLELGALAVMRFLAVVFLFLALSASALAEPVKFKDCGEPRGQSEVPAPSAGAPDRKMLRVLGWVWRVLRAARLSLGPFVEWAGVGWGRGQGAGLDKTRPLTTLSHEPMLGPSTFLEVGFLLKFPKACRANSRRFTCRLGRQGCGTKLLFISALCLGCPLPPPTFCFSFTFPF